MVRRKPIGISSRLGSSNSSLLNSIIKYEDIIEQANALRDTQAEQAYAAYNADMYPNMINVQPTVVEPIIYPTQEVALSGNASKSKKIKYDGNKNKFVNDIYDSYYRAVRPGAASDEDAARQAKFLTQKAAFETGYGRSIANTHNYGGHRNKSGWLAFSSMDDFTKRDVALLDRKWSNWRTANNETDFVNAITTNRGAGAYAPRQEYQGYIGMNNDINQRLNMGRRRLRCGGQVNRPKAFLGAVIGAFGNIANSLIQGSQQEEIARRQQEAEDRRYYSQLAANMSTVLNNRDAQEAYEKQFRMAYKNGGRRRLRQGVNITDGGYAIPIGQNTFLLRGGSHEDINETGQTGIGLNISGKEIEAEGGEVLQKTPKEVRIYSTEPMLPGGIAPADAIKAGADKDTIFRIQQQLNGDYNGDNARRRLRELGRKNSFNYGDLDVMRYGGVATRPVGRIKADIGLREILSRAYNAVSNSWLGDAWRLANRNILGSGDTEATFVDKDGNTHTVRIRGTQTGAPNYLPGRVGGFRPTDVRRAVNTTRRLANTVREATRRATPVNTAKTTTRTGRVLNAPKGDVLNTTRQQARGYAWTKAEPFEQVGYGNTHISVDPNRIDPFTGRVSFYTIGDALRTHPFAAIGGAATAGGLVLGGNYLLDNNNNSTTVNTTPVNGAPVRASVPVNNTKRTNNSGNRTYVYGEARGNNPAPYDAIQIGATPQSLSSIRVNIPMIGAQYYTPNNSAPASTGSTRTGTGKSRRRLASRGTTPNIAAFTPPSMASDYIYDTRTPYEQMKDNGFTEYGRDVIAPLTTNATTVNSTDDITSPPIEINNGNRWGTIFRGSDWVQLGADTIGSLVGGLANLNTANNMVMPREPAPIQAVKLPTTYSIGADLADNNRVVNEMLRDSRNNISSSMALNTMRNRIRLAGNDRVNSLYQTRSRAENEMLTADAKNQQDIAIRNAMIDADYQARLNEAQNRRALLRGNAYSTMLSGLSDAVGNFIDQGKQRYSDQQAMNYYMALLPEEGRTWLRRNRVDFLRRGGRIR